MSIIERYHEIFDKEILQKSRGVIFSFSPLQDQFIYQPYSHNISADSVEKLGELMRHNLFFYSYGEEEVVQHYEKDHFSSLEQAAKYAYINRLPKRADITDGLPSEVLLDLLVQLYNPQACKLAVRTILRQNDNNEIKGYDLTYFSKDETGVSLWLGQAKLGGKAYCKTDINKDLLEKFTAEYLSKQIFFVCEKRVSLTDDTKAILEAIEEINIRSMEDDATLRGKKLLDYFKSEGIRIKIPCLLAYGEETVYKDARALCQMIDRETDSIRDYFNAHTYAKRFDNFMYGLMISAMAQMPSFQYAQRQLRDIGTLLERKISIPQVKAKLMIIKEVNTDAFWEANNILLFEKVRKELRGLMQFLVEIGPVKNPIITRLTDPIIGEQEGVQLEPPYDFEDYRAKVDRYVNENGNALAIYKLTHNIPLSVGDYRELERVLTSELGSKEDYAREFGNTPFGLLVRKIAKLDHDAAMAAFSQFINDQSLSQKQITFVHKIINHIEQNGYMESVTILTKPPFDKPLSFTKLFDRKMQSEIMATINKVKDNAIVVVA